MSNNSARDFERRAQLAPPQLAHASRSDDALRELSLKARNDALLNSGTALNIGRVARVDQLQFVRATMRALVGVVAVANWRRAQSQA